MNVLVNRAIQQFYVNEDNDEYLLKCANKIELPKELTVFIQNARIQTTPFYNDDIWPAEKFIFKFEPYKKENLQVKYNSTLLISKLAPVFYLQHEFSVDCPDDPSLMSTLDGYDTQPYTIQQLEFEQQIIQSLTSKNYTQLSYAEVNEVVIDLKFPEGVTIFGPQVTVEYAMFHDVLDLCPE
ncbi:hypothetical protein CN941_29250 [Bacillus cereus]|uniref:hypothetical protein n=1 Tax=Bacillus nitratireducens TaxID=2026193 RepID=UPI00027925C5|nr:hypothetical protein [Bacillus nitratireducens]EJQ13884.1 hypothetical protein IE3_02783 [Bacillus cereus BAG3X2-1]PEA21049.1 hypothetical protein CON40_09660 [Bacillus cereus]PET94007.1 hypothetical protein CN527_28185 [Bacillus cereus]PEW01601.1 hypothetical protein CN428_14170 [Bacillus cereus]PEZ85275.1 hypothetical protein CN374_24790 [Bacillus cereus]